MKDDLTSGEVCDGESICMLLRSGGSGGEWVEVEVGSMVNRFCEGGEEVCVERKSSLSF